MCIFEKDEVYMFTLTNIPIFRRIFYAFLLATVIPGIVISVLGVTFIISQSARGQALQIAVNSVHDCSKAGGALQALNGQPSLSYQEWGQIGFSTWPGKLQQTIVTINKVRDLELQYEREVTQYYKNYEINVSPQMSHIRSILISDNPDTTFPDDQQKALYQVMSASWPTYKSTLDHILDSIRFGSIVPASTYIQASQEYNAVSADWMRVQYIADAVSNAVVQAGPSQTNPIITATLVSFLSTIIVIIMTGYFVRLTITRPLNELVLLTKRIAQGETTARAKIVGSDEIYMVASSMNSMLDNIVRLIQETQSQRDILQARVEKLVREVSGIGEGDLRVQAEVTADALGILAESFNYMVGELGSLVVRVKVVANGVERSTVSILDRMTQLVEAGDVQISEFNDTVVQVERMSTLSRQVAERSQILYNIASTAHQNAHGGREAVKQAIEDMGRINDNVQTTAGKVQMLGKRSREINEIVEVISNIAQQTNRLALDAAIQAAMAGDNGKGFGAIAGDIQRLAGQTKDHVSVITYIVQSVREDIAAVAGSMQDTERETAAGTKLTQEAGTELEAIFAAIEQQAHEINNINQMAVQQWQSSRSVVRMMHDASKTTQQICINTRSASKNMEYLTRLVKQLRTSVEAFKLREHQNYVVSNTNLGVTRRNGASKVVN
jgi:methyl-accepting chemotaxis protein